MKKTTLFLAVLLTLNGCAEINQPLESLSNKLKDLGDKIKHGDNRAETTAAPQKKNTPTLATASQVSKKSDSPTIEATSEPIKKTVPLNIAIPKEVKPEPVQETIVKQKAAEITPPAPPRTILAREVKPDPVNEHVSMNELNSHNWQINKIFMTNNFTANEDHWIFSFNKTGQYKAFAACNFLTGKFNAGDDGAFRLGKLETSLNECPESKDEEVMVFNMLLMADSFSIRGDTLVLKSGDKAMMELIPSTQDINIKMSKKTHSKKDKKETKAKVSKKKETKAKPSNQTQKQAAKKPAKHQESDKKSSSKKHPHQ
jgi:heat shock protein HslJ